MGWCISNHEDMHTLEYFLHAIKRRVGSIVPMWFMSDDASQYANSWIAVFGDVGRKLLCSWHVDRAWREKIRLIKDKEIQLVNGGN